MMKIHTTQNLNSLGRMQSTNSSTITNDEIRLNYSEQMRKQKLLLAQPDSYESGVSFKGKKEIVKKVIQKAADKETMKDKFLKSRFFDTTLNLMGHEVLVQSLISAVICMILRPATIMAIPTKKNKQDNMYASAHSMSSGAVGIVASILIATPFSKGIKYAKNNLLPNLKPDILKKKYPHLNLESIWKDKDAKIKKPFKEWKDKSKNPFSTDVKDTLTVARPTHLSQVSEKTLNKQFNLNIDLNAMKDKSVNEWVDKNGKKIHIDLKDMFIAVKEEGMESTLHLKDYENVNFFSLKHIDESFLKEIMPDLDTASIEKNGKRLHPDFWKKKDGTPYNLDMDMIHISSYRETKHATPLYTGAKREGTTKEEKYCSYQSNTVEKDKDGLSKEGVPDKLGTPVTQEMLNADAANEISDKWLGWLPDIATRIPIAAGTIMLIPWILKHIFGLEKSKKPAESVTATKEIVPAKQEINTRKAVA